VLASILPRGTDLVLLVTDESAIPSGAVRGSAEQLVQLLRDCPGFEFAMIPSDLRWIVFDTHHNTLVGAGELEDERNGWRLL
jgi:hypothetical protein